MKSDRLAVEVLKRMGFEVETLEVSIENGKKMPDFLVKYKDSSALVEPNLNRMTKLKLQRENVH